MQVPFSFVCYSFRRVWLARKSIFLIFSSVTFFPLLFPSFLEQLLAVRSVMGLPRLPSNDQSSIEPTSNMKNDDGNYNSWLRKHPSALESFEKMMKGAKRKKIVVFLDYDGTLSPIVDDPGRAFMSDEMRAAVREVAKCFPTAIISGRSRDKVKEFVKLSNVHYAGSHGMDIMAPIKPSAPNPFTKAFDTQVDDGVLFQPAKKFLPAIQQICRVLEDTTKKIEGAIVEDNRFCVSVHFRHVHDEDYGILERKVESIIQKYPEFHVTEGKKVMEIRPIIDWNKGNALEYFLHTLGYSNSTDIIPLYIGDDQTDEDAFKVIQRRGEGGFPILVSSIPKHTRASYSLKDPSQVLTFLLRLARWRKLSLISSTATTPLISLSLSLL